MNDATSEIKERDPTFGELLQQADEEIQKLPNIETYAFPVRKLKGGTSYLTIGTTNGGKTYWTWGTAISIARENENYRVAVISTEDNMWDLAELIKLNRNDPVLARIQFDYIDDLTNAGMDTLFLKYQDMGIDVVILDYLRPDIWNGYGQGKDASTAMTQFYSAVYRNLKRYPFAFIHTIQANSSMYNQPIEELLKKDPYKVVKSIEGGVKPAQRSRAVFILLQNAQGQRGLYVYKAKMSDKKYLDMVIPYGEVNEITLDIKYYVPQSLEEFYRTEQSTTSSNTNRNRATKTR